MNGVIIAAVCAAAAVCSWCVTGIVAVTGYKERKDLYNRIMCGSIRDYGYISGNAPQRPLSRHEQMLKDWRNPNPQNSRNKE